MYIKAKSFHMEILDGVNLTNKQKQLVKAAVTKMNYQNYERPIKKGLYQYFN